ncbi:alpha/beta hydrolase [Subtercola sp. Z020]|uniref:alpha/beta fold hydrolase n=1 Tax=Subtercola sp. Z020 TaxID=2080582 RepID=UPI000CE79486|nr:alpha/beta fold hydrolase [Subtercola sp. Z020]PPF79429.1 alpha/beta hydrolase [Subtercola sp. Z020]
MASRTQVDVSRVYTEKGDTYARVNTIGTTGVRPFVLVPGIGVSSTYFERLAPNLNEFGPVHALDLPGFGGVPHPDQAMTIRLYADLVGKVIDDLELTDPIIVGHSMGTQIVSDLVSRRPEISTAVLIGPVVNPRERWVARAALRFLQAAWHEPFKVKFLAVSAYLLCGFKWFSRILPEMMQYPIEKALPGIQAHTLVIRGQYDAVAPRKWVEQVGRLLPNSRLWEMPGAAHSVMHAHAEEVALLCVEHAQQATSGTPLRDSNSLRVYDTAADDIPDTAPAVSIPDAVAAVKGRLTEAVGVARGDDDLIAEGKTEHAEAMERSGDASRVAASERERAGAEARAAAARRGEPGAG